MRLRFACVVVLGAVLPACGSKSPSAPSPAPVTVTEIRVGVAGGLAAVIEPGKSAQFFAQAIMSDGTSQDVTNAAFWQTSNPAIATVSATGVVTTYMEGEVTISATMTRSGSLVVQVKKECTYSLSPPEVDTDAFGRTVRVTVTSSLGSCTWAATSSVPWIRIVGPGTGTGNGIFDYDLAGNNTPEERAADIIVSGERGTARHHVEQARPHSCSYVVEPAEIAVSLGGGSGSFRVNTTPDDCQWTARSNGYVYPRTYSGQGDRTVAYDAYANANGAVGSISICGLSGLNPCGILMVRWRN